MNTNLAVRNEGQWSVAPYSPDAGKLGPGQRTYSAAAILDFPTLMRILHHWRWLVLGVIGVGLAGAILLTLLTKPIYRATVTLEANPPSVAVSEEQSRQQDLQASDTFDFVATQVGLLGSRGLPNEPRRNSIFRTTLMWFPRTRMPPNGSARQPAQSRAD